jgi:hypothetical protein
LKILIDRTISKSSSSILRLEKKDRSFEPIPILKTISGSFKANLKLEDINEQQSFSLKAGQNSKTGNANVVNNVKTPKINKVAVTLILEADLYLDYS